MRFNYVIFDLDMTLIDSIVPLTTGANLLAREFGLPEVSYDEVLKAEKGAPNATFELLWRGLWGRYDPAWYEAYLDRFIAREYEAMRLYPGGRETLETLHRLGVGLALASNRDLPRAPLAALGVEHLFRAVVGTRDVGRPKPAPDMLLKALELLEAEAEETLFVCDSKGDIMAAAEAGVRTFSLTTGGHSREDLAALGAWRTGDRLSEALEFFSS